MSKNPMMMLMNLMSDFTTKEDLVERLEESLSDYKADPSEENYKSILMSATIMILKDHREKVGPDNFDKTVAEAETAIELFSKQKPN